MDLGQIDSVLNDAGCYLTGGDIENFWLMLGQETCNLHHWCLYCCKILKNHQKQRSFNNSFIRITGILDDLVQWYYPQSIYEIKSVPLTSIFYLTGTFKIPRNSDDIDTQICINECRERLYLYINYLNGNIHRFPVRPNCGHDIKKRYSDLEKAIRKLRNTTFFT